MSPEKKEQAFPQDSYDREILSLLQEALTHCGGQSEKPLAFVENKWVDVDLVRRVLGLSRSANHWANFGPVSMLLEKVLRRKMKVAEHKTVVVCKSGTDALHTLVRLHEKKAGKSLRWVVSAFGFIASHIGPLADAQVVDCDRQGMLSLDELKKLAIESWDGVVVTNIFGLCQDITPYRDFCMEHGKVLVMDDATAFLTPSRQIENAPDEAVSFHQTKPWGMGEGGCAVVEGEDEAEFRSLLNFGVESMNDARRYAVNGKLSDFCSALILQRLVQMPFWAPLYREQAERVHALAVQSGLQPLAPVHNETVMAHLPFLGKDEIFKDALKNPYLTLRKYYVPLAPDFDNARDIYRRIVNVPSHSQIASLDNESLLMVFEQLGKLPPGRDR